MDVVEPETFKTFTVLSNALIKSDDNYFIFYDTVHYREINKMSN